MRQETFSVYIITNKRQKPLYTGVTNNLERRMQEHRGGTIDGFPKKYGLKMLVYHEEFSRIDDAIRREKQMKNWGREWKLNLIRTVNPDFEDLFKE